MTKKHTEKNKYMYNRNDILGIERRMIWILEIESRRQVMLWLEFLKVFLIIENQKLV